MISLTRQLPWYWSINGKQYKVNMTFDNVLRWYQLLDDESKTDGQRAVIMWRMFVNASDVDAKGREKAIVEIGDYIRKRPYHLPEDAVADPSGDYADERSYSYTQDAPAIWSSILAEYGIDLEREEGKLHWAKFQALLDGLPSSSYFQRIIAIRQRSRTGLEGEELTNLVQAQEYFALDEYRSVARQNQQMNDILSAWAATAEPK
ncbi:Gp15 family bacteriophage protein [Lacticaseibacillus songhuajiangensis]|uniref:Gp15 family bacteriophage protein n=1 Tax=Lacticaseibacillus songhuajiangensis TaxID=1296539 RepID=UPI000F79E25C|nr:Gp15 family bacteriophage protein [Lacticaseibacillus songhuajiangensis]